MKGVVWATVTVEVTIFTFGVGTAWMAAGTGGTVAGGGAATVGGGAATAQVATRLGAAGGALGLRAGQRVCGPEGAHHVESVEGIYSRHGGAFPGWPVLNETAGGAVAQMTPVSCGPACAEMIAGVRQTVLLPLLGPKGMGAEQLADSIGGRGGYVSGGLPPLLALGSPWIAMMRAGGTNHFVVVQVEMAGGLLIRDPFAGGSTYQMTIQAFQTAWTGIAVIK